MNIFETLKADHVETRGLLEDIIKLTLEPISDVVASEDWAQAFEDLKRKLFAHDRAEEAVFYDALDTLGHKSTMRLNLS
jgi:protein-L-isoaspartate O-methyltransferase